MPRALVVDDDPSYLMGVAELVGREGFQAKTAESLEQAREQLKNDPPDVVLSDLVLPDGSGLDLLKDLPAGGSTEFVVITGHADVDSVIDSLRSGVLDYLTKPVDIPRLKSVLANLMRTSELKGEIGALRQQLRNLGRFGSLVGASPAMQQVYDLIGKVAPTGATVFLTGESGTGKEVVAQTIHEISRNRRGSFLPLNCGAMPAGLIESELFGHERGSFTGATQLRRGYFERASGGTLFLDEVSEMPIELQVKLLRVLETGTAIRVGGGDPIPVDVRVIAATNRPPERAVAEGKLREDLLYRLNVFPIVLPPLRERGGDVEVLADHFLEELNRAEGTTKRYKSGVHSGLRAYPWPGNVRELKNVIHRAFIMSEDEVEPVLPAEIATPPAATETAAAAHGGMPNGRAPNGGSPNGTLRPGTPLAEVERHVILATLQQNSGDKRRTAEMLGISLKTLYNRLKLYARDSQPPQAAPPDPESQAASPGASPEPTVLDA